MNWFNNMLTKWRFRRTPILLAMRRDDMLMAHPNTDWSYKCDKCDYVVGLYPSGQSVVNQFGRENVIIVCVRCKPPRLNVNVPESIEKELAESVPYKGY